MDIKEYNENIDKLNKRLDKTVTNSRFEAFKEYRRIIQEHEILLNNSENLLKTKELKEKEEVFTRKKSAVKEILERRTADINYLVGVLASFVGLLFSITKIVELIMSGSSGQLILALSVISLAIFLYIFTK